MLTKKQACKSIVEEFLDHAGYVEIEESHAMQSSSLAVAMEYLGLLTSKEMKDYASTRAGLFMCANDGEEVKVLTTREFLALLPD
jgi:hypothetical protein